MQAAEKVTHLHQSVLAKRWGISEGTLERWRSDNIGPAFIKLHGRVLYRIEDVESYEVQCLRPGSSRPLVNRGAA